MLANRVREYSTTTGTGDITLSGAMPGHVRFSDAFSVGDEAIYVVEDGDNYEIGTGTLAAGGVLQRTTVHETLVDGTLTKTGASAISLSGNQKVYCTVTADFLLSPTEAADVITEVTPGAGVTIDGVLIKDGGATFAGEVRIGTDLVLSGDTITIDANTETLTVSGGITSSQGGAARFYGPAHSSFANDVAFFAAGSTKLNWDHSANHWNFQGTVAYHLPSIIRGTSVNDIGMSGGSAWNLGANIRLRGESHATEANDILFMSSSMERLRWDESALSWNFGTNIITGVSDLRRGVTSSLLTLSGGSTLNNGANLLMYAESHATAPNKIVFRKDSAWILEYNGFSAWNFQGNNISNAANITSNDTINAGGDIISGGYFQSIRSDFAKIALNSTTPGVEWLVENAGGDLALTVEGVQAFTLDPLTHAASFAGRVNGVSGADVFTAQGNNGVAFHISAAEQTPVNGLVYGAIGWTPAGGGGGSSPRAAIAAVQQSIDNDVMGLNFYVHPSQLSADPMDLALTLNADKSATFAGAGKFAGGTLVVGDDALPTGGFLHLIGSGVSQDFGIHFGGELNPESKASILSNTTGQELRVLTANGTLCQTWKADGASVFANSVSLYNALTITGAGGANLKIGNTSGPASGALLTLDGWDGTSVVPAVRMVGFGDGGFRLDTNGTTTALSIDTEQKATFTSTVSAPQMVLDEMAEIVASSANIVDVFLYDTTKDSDGGAWRHRGRRTSWYNETLNTATRGATRKFPKVALIVAEIDTVTIYDATAAGVPMWMVFENGAGHHISSGSNLTSAAISNGLLCIGGTNTTGLLLIDFLTDAGAFFSTSAYKKRSTNIAGRNTAGVSYTVSSQNIVSEEANDVAITTLPGAEIDPVTGLPYPTIAVATDGGVSVINPDGSAAHADVVVDITGHASALRVIDFMNNMLVCSGKGSNQLHVFVVPSSDIDESAFSEEYTAGSVPALKGGSAAANDAIDALVGLSGDIAAIGIYDGNGNGGVNLFVRDTTTPANGMVAYITRDYNTGWMPGDIQGAWLADSVAETIEDTELVTNGDFSSGATGWTIGANWSVGSGVISGSSATASDRFRQTISLTAGKVYTITFTISNYVSGTVNASLRNGDAALTNSAQISGNGTHTVYIEAAAGYNAVGIAGATAFTGDIDDISVTEAVADRSVKANHLSVVGSLTKSAVATGAEVMGASVNSAGPDNYCYAASVSGAELNGDFTLIAWIKPSSVSSTRYVLSAGEPVNGKARMMGIVSAKFQFDGWGGAAQLQSDTDLLSVNEWSLIVVTGNNNGVSSEINLYHNGKLVKTGTVTLADVTVGAGDIYTHTSLGAATNGFTGEIALARMSAYKATAEQIAKIYTQEKWLFRENAKCLLGGSSNAVQALAYDDDTDELFVGTADGVSVMQGLTRLEHITGGLHTSNAIKALAANKEHRAVATAAEASLFAPEENLRERA